MPIMKSCTRPFLAAVEPLHYRLFAPPQRRRDRECWYSFSTRDRQPAGFRDLELRHLDQLPTNAESLEGDGYEIIVDKAGKQSNTETLHPQHSVGASIQSGIRDHRERSVLLGGEVCHVCRP